MMRSGWAWRMSSRLQFLGNKFIERFFGAGELAPNFFVFIFGVGVENVAAAGLYIGVFAIGKHGANRDGKGAVAVKRKVSDGTAVGAAAITFQLVDNSHGFNFGGAS